MPIASYLREGIGSVRLPVRTEGLRDVSVDSKGHMLDAVYAAFEGALPMYPPRIDEIRQMRGKRVQFDDETWQALDLLGHDTGKDFQELASEAFGDLIARSA